MHSLALNLFAGDLPSRHFTAVCFGLALFASLYAGRYVLASLMGLGIIDSYELYRFKLHLWIRAIIRDAHPAHSDFYIQSWALAASLLAGLVVISFFAKFIRQMPIPRGMEVFGTAGIISMYVVEFISREDMEHTIYILIGPFVVFTWIVGLFSLIVAIGACLEGYHLRRRA
jgi:hypothetical protein